MTRATRIGIGILLAGAVVVGILLATGTGWGCPPGWMLVGEHVDWENAHCVRVTDGEIQSTRVRVQWD